MPWLFLYTAFTIFITSLLIYFLVILENIWIKVIIFLVVAPSLVICVSCLLAVWTIHKLIKLTGKAGWVYVILNNWYLNHITIHRNSCNQMRPILYGLLYANYKQMECIYKAIINNMIQEWIPWGITSRGFPSVSFWGD